MRAFFETRASGVVLVFALLLLWEMSVRLGWVTSENWPAFSNVLGALWSGIADGEILHATVSSLWRMAAGYALGVLLGIVLGLIAAVAGGRVLSSVVLDVPSWDPATLAVVTLVLLSVALLACAVPARRALAVEPMEALRHE